MNNVTLIEGSKTRIANLRTAYGRHFVPAIGIICLMHINNADIASVTWYASLRAGRVNLMHI